MALKLLTLPHNMSKTAYDHPDYDDTLLHLEACDLIDQTSHSESESEEVCNARHRVLDLFASSASDLTSPLLQGEARAVPVETAAGGDPCYEADQIAYTRPEYLSARAFKPTPDSPIGVFLVNRQDAVYISRIARDGLFGKSNLKAGDRLISVNGVSCLHAPAKAVAQLIGAAESSVSLTVRDKDGNPNIVSSSVQKLSLNRMTGIGFKNRRGALYLTRVDTYGLFGDSLVMPGHRCLMVNQCLTPNTPSREAAKIVAEARDFVTIVSRPDASSAMVLACEYNRMWYSGAALAFGVAAGALGAAGAGSF